MKIRLSMTNFFSISAVIADRELMTFHMMLSLHA